MKKILVAMLILLSCFSNDTEVENLIFTSTKYYTLNDGITEEYTLDSILTIEFNNDYVSFKSGSDNFL